jgi:hypothetical protein
MNSSNNSLENEMKQAHMNKFDVMEMDMNYLKRINYGKSWNGYMTKRLKQALNRHYKRLGE